jgi:hypothetical protein
VVRAMIEMSAVVLTQRVCDDFIACSLSLFLGERVRAP